MFKEISEDKITPKTCPDHMKVRFWVMNLNSFDRFFEFMKTISNERNWACHFAVDSSSI